MHPPFGAFRFQYHDHTADIIVHAWGASLSEAFAQARVLCAVIEERFMEHPNQEGAFVGTGILNSDHA